MADLPGDPVPPKVSSDSGGVKVFPIASRFENERHRLAGGFTDADRAWRHQFQKDQILSKNEPRPVPEMYTELTNPLRRFYKAPWRKLEKALAPTVGPVLAFNIKFWTPKIMMSLVAAWSIHYYFKYHTADWTRKFGWRMMTNRPTLLPGDARYPDGNRDRFVPADYNDQGFKDRKVFLN